MSTLYTILDLPETATDAEIKQAYRLLAKRYHPDLHPGDAAMAKKFAEVNEAMETLGNPTKRKEYDAQRLADKKKAEAQAAAAQAAAANAARMRAQAAARAQQAASGRGTSGVYAGTAQGAATVINDAYRKGYNEGFAAGQAAGTAAANAARNTTAETWKKSADKWKTEAETYRGDVDTLKQALEKSRQRVADAEAALHRTESALRIQTAATEEARKNAAAEAAARLDLQNAMESKLSVEREARRFSDADKVRLTRELTRLKEENEELRSRLGEWEAYGESEEEDEELTKITDDWAERLKEYKKQYKDSHYGTLGVYFWATDEEIEAAYKKRSKRLKTAQDLGKLKAANEAYNVLIDPDARRQYNGLLGIAESDIVAMRAAHAEYERVLERLDQKAEEEDLAAYISELTERILDGDGEAALALGELYLSGEGVPKNETEAVRCFMLGAEKEVPDALYHLGLCYLNGEGVESDPDHGVQLLKEAAAKGSESAREFIDAADRK